MATNPANKYSLNMENKTVRPSSAGSQPEDVIPNFGASTYGWNGIPFPCVVGKTIEEASKPFEYDEDSSKLSCKLSWRAFNLLKCERIWDRNKPKFWRFLTQEEQDRLVEIWKNEIK